MGKAKWNISTDQELIYVHISIEIDQNSGNATRPMSITQESSRDFADSTPGQDLESRGGFTLPSLKS